MDLWPEWPEALRESAERLVELALDEDLGEGDLTARYFSEGGRRLRVRLVARQSGVLAGLPLFLHVFERLARRQGGQGIEVLEAVGEGVEFQFGDILARLSGEATLIHSAERTALNFLQRLSAVATRTREAVRISCGPRILDTRKTTPGYRLLEKYAVRMGGGVNHRMGLYDAVMVKDNHKEALGGMGAVMDRVAALPGGFPVIVEVDDLEELRVLLTHPAKERIGRVLLDNFDPADAPRALALREEAGGGPDFEVSGGLRAEDLADPRYEGIEYASLGELTHSAAVVDLALEVEA